MKNLLIEEDKIYLLSNHAVARNPLFSNPKIMKHFKDRMEKDLSPLCKIVNFLLQQNEFQILVKMKARKEFEHFYLNKNRSSRKDKIPESGYIFSQQMSNLQVSLVKKYNKMFNRSGTLMAKRYLRKEVISLEEFTKINERIDAGKKLFRFSGIWENRIMQMKEAWNGEWLRNLERKFTVIESETYLDLKNFNLVGYFKTEYEISKNPAKSSSKTGKNKNPGPKIE